MAILACCEFLRRVSAAFLAPSLLRLAVADSAVVVDCLLLLLVALLLLLDADAVDLLLVIPHNPKDANLASLR